MACSPAPIRITHVLSDDPLIKVYGICDDSQFAVIEKVLESHSERLRLGEGAIRTPADATPGNMVLVPRFYKYRRAEILHLEDGGKKAVVQFLDIGGKASYPLYDLRLISAITPYNLATLPVVPPSEYILANVLKSGEWTPAALETVNAICKITGQALLCSVASAIGKHLLLTINYASNGENYSSYVNFLVNQSHAVAATPEQVKNAVCAKYAILPTPNHQFRPSHSVPLGLNQFSVPSTMPNNFYSQPRQPVLPTPVNLQPYGVRPTISAVPMQPTFSRLHGPRPSFQLPKTEPIPQNFISETLPVGSQHEVFVSNVIDGLQNFIVQLKSSVEKILTPLMVALNDKPAEPFTDPLQPGTVCLGRYAADNALCRAVVSTVLADGANLYFVDFGNSEIVPFNEIYKIRPEFMRQKMVAIRFSLAGCADDYTLTTKEAEKVFSNLTMNTFADNLLLKVTKPETPLKQFCELFIKTEGKVMNIKSKVLDKMRMLQPAQYDRIPFKKNSQADVVVPYVESPARFFVQSMLNEFALNNVMKEVERYCATNDDKEVLYVEDVNENMAVCALYEEDGQWYRAIVMNEPDPSTGAVEVLFVDYGNHEAVHFSNLRIMTNEMVSCAPMQAVECRLDFDADLSLRDDVIQFFNELLEGKELAMHVLNVLPAKVLLVDLVDKETNQNIKEILIKTFQPPPVSPPSDTRSRGQSRPQSGSQGNWRERQNSSASGDGDFSAFKTHKPEVRNNYAATDETDNINNRFSSRDSAPKRYDDQAPKRYNRNDDEKTDSWSKKPSRQDDSWNNSESTGRWSQHDDRTNADNDGGGRSYKPHGGRDDNGWPPSRDNDGFKSRGRDNDRDGGRSFNRDDRWGDKGGDSWNKGRGGDDDGRKSFQKQDTWSKNDDSESKNDSWGAKKKDDDWSGNRRGGDSSWGDNRRGGDRDSKPSFGNREDRGENRFREKRDFGGGGWNNDRGSRSGGWKNDSNSGSWGAPKTPSLEPAYERGATYAEPDYQPGQELQVVTTWFVSPSQFFVMPVENNEFRTMMDSFQEDYSRREPIDLNSLTANECIVARDKDEVIYRAKFSRGRPGGAIVTFVDYGNTATVKKGEVWAVSQEHCTIPIQAICCQLHDISPVDENTPWSQVEGVDKFFEGDSYTLTVVECIDDGISKTWSVHLSNAEGANIGDLMVENGLAVRKNVLKSEELFDLSLLKNQVLAVFPGAVISSKKFFLHLDPETAQVIGAKIKELVEVPENLVSLSAEEIVEGKFCLTCSDDDEYYRALILSVESAAETARIVFIDYGDEMDVPFSQVKVLPDYLCVYNAQIAECCLHGGENFEEEDSFSEAVVGNDLLIKVVDVIDEKLHVILYDVTTGDRLPFPEATDEKVAPLCALPILKLNDAVTVSHIGNEKVFIQRVADESYLTSFSDRMFAVYDAQEVEKVALEVDKFYAAKSGKFETWYRCKAADSECQEVFYIDYGNTEPLDELIALKPLEEEFFTSFMFCVGVSTSVHFTAEDLTPLIDGVAEVVFNGTFKPIESGEWHVDLVCQSTSKTLADFAVEFGCGEPVPPSVEEPPAYSVFPTWNLSEEKIVKISNVDSPDCIHLQSVEDEPKLVTLQDELRASLKRILPLQGPYDDLIAAQKEDDKEWYRARPSSGDLVFAIDFGFTFQPLAVKKLPNSFKQDKSNYIVSCALNIQPSEGDSWSQEVISRLVDLRKNATQVTAKLEFIKHHVKYVDISTDGSSVSEVFVADGIAVYKAHEVVISHPNSIKDFYVQFSEDLDEIYALLEKLKEAETWEPVEPEADKVFAAQFVDDEQWYRAIVTNTQEDDSKIVEFIDYGNEGSSTQFKALPNDLQTLPPYAIQCCQYTTPDNADELDELFIEYIDSAEGYFSAYVVSGGQPMMVMLEHNGKHIDQILTEKKMLLEWKLEPATIGEKVVVSHINSPSSFYVRNETATLEEVETALAELDSAEPLTEFAVDDIVAAKFPDDGLWYRAKVIEVVEKSTTVLFFDYGNTSEVTEVRSLPDGAKLTPCSAKHCSFPVPAEQGEWPDVASDRFAELNCDGDTVFDVTIKEDGDPAVVDLFDHGTSVAEELATICKADLTAPTRESSKEVVILSHVAGLDGLWIQSQSPQLDEMVNEMANVETFDDLESASVGMLVAAQYEEEWYRASVLEELESGYKVLFIDYGNESDVSMIKSLPEDLATLTPLAKCCRLKDIPADIETTVPDILEKLQEFVDQSSTFYVDELVESEGLNVVSLSLCNDGKILSQYLMGVEQVAEENSLVPQTDEEVAVTAENALTESGVDHVTKENSLVPQAAEEVAVTAENAPTESSVDHVTKDDSIDPQTAEEVAVEESVNENDTTLEVTVGDALTQSVNEEDITFIEPATDLNAEIVVEDACVKPSTDSVPAELENSISSTADGAEVLSKEFEKITVTLSPVESTVEIPAESTESVAPTNLNEKDVETNSAKNGGDEASTEEDNDADYKTPPSKSIDNDIYATPERLMDESSASGELETSYSYSSALSILDSPEYAELFTLPEQLASFENHEFQISHVSGADDFYIQKYDDLKRVDLISKSLKAIVEGGSLTPLTNPVVSSLAAAKFDDKWYRVKILEISDSNSSSVLCIDHGNVFSSEDLYELPEKLHSLPSLAYHCTQCVCDGNKQKMNEKVDEFVRAQNSKMKVEVIKMENDQYVIEPFYDGGSEKLLHPPEAEPSEEKKEEFENDDHESTDASAEKKEAENACIMPVSEKLPSEPDCSPEAEFKLMESAEFEENEPKIEVESVSEESSSSPHSSSGIESNVEEQTETIASSTERAEEKLESEIETEEPGAVQISTEPVLEEPPSATSASSEPETIEKEEALTELSTETCSVELEPDNKDAKLSDSVDGIKEVPIFETEIKSPIEEQESMESVTEMSTLLSACLRKVQKVTEQTIKSRLLDCATQTEIEMARGKVLETSESDGEHAEISYEESPHLPSPMSEVESEESKLNEEQIDETPEKSSCSLSPSDKVVKNVLDEEKLEDEQLGAAFEKSTCSLELKTTESVENQEPSVKETEITLEESSSEVEVEDAVIEPELNEEQIEKTPEKSSCAISPSEKVVTEVVEEEKKTCENVENQESFGNEMKVEDTAEEPNLNEKQIEKTPEKSSCALSPSDEVVEEEKPKFEKSPCSSESKSTENGDNPEPTEEQTETAPKESSCSPESNHKVELESASHELRIELSINASVEKSELEPKLESHDLTTEPVAEQHSPIPLPEETQKSDEL